MSLNRSDAWIGKRVERGSRCGFCHAVVGWPSQYTQRATLSVSLYLSQSSIYPKR